MSTDPTRRKIALLGLFGTGNLGNECTLQAIVLNIRRFLPNAELSCICPRPENATSTHNIPAFPIRAPFPIKGMFRFVQKSNGAIMGTNGSSPETAKEPSRSRLFEAFIGLKLLLRTLAYPLLEPYRWFEAITRLKGNDMLIIPGLGMLGDFGIRTSGIHYDILRWSIIAKLCRCKLLFVSVGAGPIRHPISRYFVKTALRLADYRSYRDAFSKSYMESIGFDTKNDGVYPDLAYSLPKTLLPRNNGHGSRSTVIGVGLINYFNRQATPTKDDTIYRQYISKVGAFVIRLLERTYTVRILIGDTAHDQRVRQDLRALLEGHNKTDYQEKRIIDEPAASVAELLSQLASTDVVVSSRFHNLLLALMLTKPVLAISYHEKFEPLMSGAGLTEFCQDIEHIDIDHLLAQLTRLQENAEYLRPQIAEKTEANRRALDEQYNLIFQGNLHQPA